MVRAAALPAGGGMIVEIDLDSQVRTLGVDTPTALRAVSHALAGRRRGVAT